MILEFQSNNKEVVLPIVIQLYGGFVAVLVGVYIPLAEAKKKERQEERRRMIASLKLIWSELDINEIVMRNILLGLQTMPRKIDQMYDSVLFVLNVAKDLRTEAYYGAISSATIMTISESDAIFNSLQQAYYNMQLTESGLSMTADVYKEYYQKNLATIPQEFKAQVLDIHDKEIKKCVSAITFIATAKKISGAYLSKTGVTFSQGAYI